MLRCEGVTVGYGGEPVVHDMAFSVPRGGFACLLGPSGSGKSTVLRAIAGVQPLQAGSIELGGRVVSSPAFTLQPERRRIGFVFQDNALFPHLSVAGNIEFGLRANLGLGARLAPASGRCAPARLSGEQRRARVQELLDVMGLTGSANRYAHELSGGQQQRVALARALAPEPELVLLDEPFSSLDADLRERVGAEVRAILRERGITAVLVTHDQREAFALSDAIGVWNDGRMRQWDSAYNLYHRPAERFVADFIGQGVLLRGKLVAPDAVDTELGVIRGSRVASTRALDGETDEPAPANSDCQPMDGPRIGAVVDVLLRPDDIQPDPGGDIEATVVKRAFQGAQILYSLRLATGSEVLSLFPSHHDHAEGAQVRIRVVADHLVAFAV
ncbi:MAG: ABC transporter ATP-binding protein [Gammaproteobacteria bacterium]